MSPERGIPHRAEGRVLGPGEDRGVLGQSPAALRSSPGLQLAHWVPVAMDGASPEAAGPGGREVRRAVFWLGDSLWPWDTPTCNHSWLCICRSG